MIYIGIFDRKTAVKGLPYLFDQKSQFSRIPHNSTVDIASYNIINTMSSYYIDLKYVKLLGGRLSNFKQKKSTVFAFSHSCESVSDRIKTRGNFYQAKDGTMMFHCYHCNASGSFANFLSKEDPNLYSEYRMETFKESTMSSNIGSQVLFKSAKIAQPEIKSPTIYLDTDIIPIDQLSSNSSVVSYLKSRHIPTEYWPRLGVVTNFNKFASKYDSIFSGLNNVHPRLIFTFYDVDDSVICYSGRSFGKEKPKYITVMIDKTRPKLYGLWKLDFDKTIYAVEGQIDSMFLDNAIAVNGADYSLPFLLKHQDNIIVVPDSDWKRNPQVYQSLEKTVNAGFKISLLPDSIPWKDLNDCVVKGGFNKDKLIKIVNENVYSGNLAILEMTFRKKFTGNNTHVR